MPDSRTFFRSFAAVCRDFAADLHGSPMTTTTCLGLAALAATAAIAAGCGDDGNTADVGAAASEKPQSRPPTVPAELLGRYTTTLQRADLPHDPPPEVSDGSPRWKLTIAKSGGIENGPAFTIANAQLGVLESSNFAAQEGTVLLEHEECAAPGGESSYTNKYRYAVSGDTLRFTTIANGCADKVAETILTSRPWHRSR
jgi:hypothetical protein